MEKEKDDMQLKRSWLIKDEGPKIEDSYQFD
jgi:hypothetical protein